MTSEIIFAHPIGLGDHLICNGLVNYFSEQYEKLYLPVKEEYIPTIKHLYQDNNKVTLIPITMWIGWNYPGSIDKFFELYNCPIIKVDVLSEYRSIYNVQWYEWFYTQFGLSYKHRYDLFKLPNDLTNSYKLYEMLGLIGKKYKVIHNNSSRNVELPFNFPKHSEELQSVVINPYITTDFLDWTEILLNAEEIHVSSSSAFCMVDSIQHNIKGRIFYHDIIDTGDLYLDHNDLKKFNSKWEIIEYENKF